MTNIKELEIAARERRRRIINDKSHLPKDDGGNKKITDFENEDAN